MKVQLKQMMFIGICVFCFSASGHAESMYVTDVLKLTLRSGPGADYKILAMLESGQKVNLLESGEDWSQVELANGKKGYVLARYLLPEPTHSVRLEELRIKHKTLTQQAAALLEENTRFKDENNKLKASLQNSEKMLKDLSDNYNQLKADSTDFINLKSKYKKISIQLAEQKQRADTLDEQLSGIERNQYIKWFLAGSGVLLVGFIVGFSAKRGRRRSSLL